MRVHTHSFAHSSKDQRHESILSSVPEYKGRHPSFDGQFVNCTKHPTPLLASTSKFFYLGRIILTFLSLHHVCSCEQQKSVVTETNYIDLSLAGVNSSITWRVIPGKGVYIQTMNSNLYSGTRKTVKEDKTQGKQETMTI